jgi:hypothetical protein
VKFSAATASTFPQRPEQNPTRGALWGRAERSDLTCSLSGDPKTFIPIGIFCVIYHPGLPATSGGINLVFSEGTLTSSEMLFPTMIFFLCLISLGILGGIALVVYILKRLFEW